MGFVGDYAGGTTVSEEDGYLYVTTGSGYCGRAAIRDHDQISEQAAEIARNPQATTEPGDWPIHGGEWISEGARECITLDPRETTAWDSEDASTRDAFRAMIRARAESVAGIQGSPCEVYSADGVTLDAINPPE